MYSSKFNREALDHLRFGMSLDYFLKYREFIKVQELYEAASARDTKAEYDKNAKKP